MEKDEKRIPLKYGTAVVSKDISPETVEALNKMCELAYNIELTLQNNKPMDELEEKFKTAIRHNREDVKKTMYGDSSSLEDEDAIKEFVKIAKIERLEGKIEQIKVVHSQFLSQGEITPDYVRGQISDLEKQLEKLKDLSNDEN